MQKLTEATPGGSSWTRRILLGSLVTLLGIGALALTLIATVPLDRALRLAGVELPAGIGLTGTLWHGGAQLPGGEVVRWDSHFGQSLMALGIVADVQVAGGKTDLTGQAELGFDEIRLAEVEGRLDWVLLDAIAPGFEVTCATVATVDIASAAVSRLSRAATGRIALDSGTCARRDGSVTGVALPALVADVATSADGIDVTVTAADAPEQPLGRLLVTPDDRLKITIRAVAAAMVPGLPTGGDSEIDLPLVLFVPQG